MCDGRCSELSQVYIQLGEIGILHRPNEVTQPRWRQDNAYKLIFGTQGAMTFETPQLQLNIRRGQFLLLNPEIKHQQIHCDGDKFLVEFSPALVREVVCEVMGPSAVDVSFEPIPVVQQELTRLASSLIPELHATRPGHRLLLEHAALQLLVLAIRRIQPIGSTTEPKVDTPSVQKAIRLMMESHRDSLTLTQIAAYADMSKFSLIRQFREVVGATPYEWLQQYRIRRVSEDLLQAHRTILDIALDHGFSSVSAMNRQFRRLYGLSPTQWRRLHQQDVDKSDENDANPGNIE